MQVNKRFAKGMILYALIFLLIAGIGLAVFWNFIEAYEQSRPINAVKAYMEVLTEDDMCDASETLLARIDENIQSKEEACEVIRASVSDDLSYAKKAGDSSGERQVYVLRDGQQIVGQIAITPGDEERFGFRVWSVTEEFFDFSYLLNEAVSVTVPSDFSVMVNGYTLDESYITEKEIPYEVLEAFYDDFSLPTLVTYTFESFLGELAVDVIDREGKTIQITEETSYSTLLPGCNASQTTQLEQLVNEFIGAYVTFTGSSNGTVNRNYANLRKFLIQDSDLAYRLYTAIDGLDYAQSRGDSIQQILINQLADVGNARYYCDLTYIVETLGREGAVETTNNLRVIILETDDGLKIEAMTRY